MKSFASVWDFGLNSFEPSEASACLGVDPGGYITGGVVVVTANQKTIMFQKAYRFALHAILTIESLFYFCRGPSARLAWGRRAQKWR